MVLGWKYPHSMQRFWGSILLFGNFVKNDKIGPKPLHGMGSGPVLSFLVKLAKTRCVSDLALLILVRHAASFGRFGSK